MMPKLDGYSLCKMIKKNDAEVSIIFLTALGDESSEVKGFGSIKLQLDTYKVYVDEEEVELTLKEFNILKFMIQSYPMVVSREMLMDKVWGYEYYGDTRVIDAHMKNIRKKIKEDYIKTIKGVGYVLEK